MDVTTQTLYVREAAEYLGLEEDFIQELIQEGVLYFKDEWEEFKPEKLDQPLLHRIGRLHRLMGVNAAGIEVIMQMRERMIAMQQEMDNMRRQLQFYEGGEDTQFVIVID